MTTHPPSHAEVRNEWRYTPIAPYDSWRVQEQLTKQEDNIQFYIIKCYVEINQFKTEEMLGLHPTLRTTVLECTTTKAPQKTRSNKMNWTHQLLVYANDVGKK
jgi:protein tyrosine phosphatase